MLTGIMTNAANTNTQAQPTTPAMYADPYIPCRFYPSADIKQIAHIQLYLFEDSNKAKPD